MYTCIINAISDTVSRSGVFCTLYNTIQQLKTEQIVNIYQILKSLRMQKPLFVPNEVSTTLSINNILYCISYH